MTEDQLRALMGDLSAVQLVLWVLAAIALVIFVVKLWPLVTKFVATVNALADLPAKLETINTIETKVVGIEAQVKEIHHETHFNSGTSIKDATVRIEQKVDGLQELMESADSEIAERVDDLENTLNPGKGK